MTDTAELRTVYCQEMIRLAEHDHRIVTVDADLMRAAGMTPFRDRFPERAFDVGVAEANMIGVAAGLAAMGKIPFAHSFSAFATRRCFDQIAISVAYAKQNVKIVGSEPGISAELNGGTHMSFDDVNIMRAVPGMVVVEPVDAAALISLLPQVAEHPGAVYLRLYRKAPETVYAPGTNLRLGRASIVRDGTDVVVIAAGLMVSKALAAADSLAGNGISVQVMDMHTIKPFDADAVLEATAQCRAVVTAENHSIIGGLGSATAECLAEHRIAVPFSRLGVEDRFGEVGLMPYLLDELGLSVQHLVNRIKDVLKGKE